MNWGKGIVLTFVVFAGLIVTLVTISMRQDVSLVASDYYVQEIAYQDQIERINNEENMEVKPVIEKNGEFVKLTIKNRPEKGEVHFFRPSEAKLDRKFGLKLNDKGEQVIPILDMKKGLWKIKVNWQSKGKEFYSEYSIVL